MRWLILLSFVVTSLGQWEENLHSCCSYSSDRQSGDLGRIRCVQRLNTTQEANNTGIVFATYSFPDQFEYSSFTAVANAAYMSFHGYPFIYYDPRMEDFEPADPRWNKIKILSSALHPTTGWARAASYLVWVDPQTIFLDFEKRIESITDRFPDAHVIFSETSTDGIGNNGVIILRVSKFSRQFLDFWWGYEDEDMERDSGYHLSMIARYQKLRGPQVRLEEIYSMAQSKVLFDSNQYQFKSKREKAMSKWNDASKFVRLAPNELESDYPVFTKFSGESFVLNLADELVVTRTTAFRQAFDEVCRGLESSLRQDKKKLTSILGPSLTIDRELLFESAKKEYPEAIEALESLVESSSEEGELDLAVANQLDHHLQKQAAIFEKIMKHEDASTVRKQNFDFYYDYLRGPAKKKNAALMKKNNGVGITDWPTFLARGVEAGKRFILLAKAADPLVRREVGDRCKTLLRELEKIVSSDFKQSVQSNWMQLYAYLGDFEYEVGEYHSAQMAYENAIRICNASPNVHECFLYPLFALGKTHLGATSWTTAMGAFDGVVSNVIKTQRLQDGETVLESDKNEYDGSLLRHQGDRTVDSILVKTLLSRALAFAKMGDTTAAQKDLSEANRFNKRSPIKLEDVRELKATVRAAIVVASEKDAEVRRKERERQERDNPPELSFSSTPPDPSELPQRPPDEQPIRFDDDDDDDDVGGDNKQSSPANSATETEVAADGESAALM